MYRMLFALHQRWPLLLAGGIFFIVFAVIGWWYWTHREAQFDALILKVFDNTARVQVYGQHVQTETELDDRHISVIGEYLIDDQAKKYSSRATTTLILPDGSAHSFTLDTITIGDDLFTKVQTLSVALNLSVPSSPEWKRFKTNSIPSAYRDIATPRPPLDNLSLFKRGKEFLILRSGRLDETVEGERLARYSFTLSSGALAEQNGPVSMIAERVGANGTVDVWVDERTASVRHIFFSQNPYFSSTTITNLDLPPSISPPIAVGD